METRDRAFRASNRENMKKWILGLESGAFRQAKNQLRVSEYGPDMKPTGLYGYCCMGVATEVAKLNGLPNLIDQLQKDSFVAIPPADGSPYKNGYASKDENGRLYTENSHLPPPVQEWLGLTKNNPLVASLQPTSAYPTADNVLATTANDDKKWSFERIATELRYTYMIDFTPEQVRAAARYEQERGHLIRAREILEMLEREGNAESVADLPPLPDRSKWTPAPSSEDDEDDGSSDSD